MSYEEQVARDLDDLKDYLSDGGDDECDDLEDLMLDESFKTTIVVDKLPLTTKEKMPKLLDILKKIYTQMGELSENGIYMPFDEETQKTSGFAFVEYTNPEDAAKAIANTDGYVLGKQTFKVTMFDDIQRFMDVPDELEPLPERQFTPSEDPTWRLCDGRDQLVLRHGMETEVAWNDMTNGAGLDMVYAGEREKEQNKNWCEQYVQWSPRGKYLMTYHQPGIALWGGPNMTKAARFEHRGVQRADLSPCEKYVCTTVAIPGNPRAQVVWNIRTGKEIRAFPYPAAPPAAQGEQQQQPPRFQPMLFSPRDTFAAKMGSDCITVYSLPSMQLLDKRSLKMEGVRGFCWSPTDDIIASWSAERSNAPARVILTKMPSRKELAVKNLFNVSGCEFIWHPRGDFLAVKVDRLNKRGKAAGHTTIEVFRLRDPSVPVVQLEIQQPIAHLGWEGSEGGTRFVLVLGDVAPRYTVNVYDMNGNGVDDAGAPGAAQPKQKQNKKRNAYSTGVAGKELTRLYSLTGKSVNRVYWSPAGSHFLLTSEGDMSNGSIEFHDADTQTMLTTQEHFSMTGVAWSPSGRYVASFVTQTMGDDYYKNQLDNGYTMWSFQGAKLFELNREKFYMMQWRPRPPSLLTKEAREEVVRNLKTYERRYVDADKAHERAVRLQSMADKVEKQRAFEELLARNAARLAAGAEARAALRGKWGGVGSGGEEFVEQDVEEVVVLQLKEEVVKTATIREEE